MAVCVHRDSNCTAHLLEQIKPPTQIIFHNSLPAFDNSTWKYLFNMAPHLLAKLSFNFDEDLVNWWFFQTGTCFVVVFLFPGLNIFSFC